MSDELKTEEQLKFVSPEPAAELLPATIPENGVDEAQINDGFPEADSRDYPWMRNRYSDPIRVAASSATATGLDTFSIFLMWTVAAFATYMLVVSIGPAYHLIKDHLRLYYPDIQTQTIASPELGSSILGMNLSQIPASVGDDILNVLPLALFGCLLLSLVVVWMARESRSREVDWSDSNLFLEYSGPLTLAIKWTSITCVQQVTHWDIITGRQPAFRLRTSEDIEFAIKLTDIARKHNIGAFFSLIKTNAPNAELRVDPSFATDNSYTELWLKYFSTPTARDRTGPLEQEMLLDHGRYQIIGTIGGGGQGTAYLAVVKEGSGGCASEVANEQSTSSSLVSFDDKEHIEHILSADRKHLTPGTQVVLKEYVLPVHRGHLTAERTAEKLKAEAEILRKLDHPQIVRIEDAFIEDIRGYLVLEYVNGESLKSLIDRLGPASEKQVVDWTIQVCQILDYLHGLSPPVVHRDITPDNLLLQEDGTLKLVDFNVAYQVDSSSTATVVGKHSYIPPEQFRGKPTPQSDLYALGGTMHYLLTGKDPEPITRSHPRSLNPSVSEKLDQIVATATSVSAASRYENAQAMVSALREV